MMISTLSRTFFAFCCLLFAYSTTAQISVLDNNPLPVETFASLASTGTASTVPAGWQFLETGSSANATYTAGAGGGTAGDTYSFGANASGERAFGGQRSGNVIPILGVSYQNNTGAVISSIAITYTGEQWRLGTAGRADRLDFSYKINATAINDATGYIDADQFDFTSPATTGTAGARDGNAVGFRSDISNTVTGLNIQPGETIWFRWTDFDAAGADDGLAIDDFTVTFTGSGTPACTEPAQATALNLSSLSSSSIDVSFTGSGASGYMIVRSTSSTLSTTPQDGISYTTGNSFGGGTIISIGTATGITDNGLNAGTLYYYFVFSFNNTACAGGPDYNAVALTGNQFTQGLSACTTPAAATALVLTPANTVVTGSFTGSGASKYLVIRSLASTLSVSPVNGATYNPTQSFGGGTVIAYGASTNFTASGLTTATPYYFFVYAANDACSGEPFYSATALTGNTTTTSNPNGVPAGYYNATTGLTCGPLKNALAGIISSGQVTLSYGDLDDVYMPITDVIQNDAGNASIIWDIYTNNSTGPEPFVFNSSQNPSGGFCGGGAVPNTEGSCWNKEHTFPRSWFGQQLPTDADLFVVRPTDRWVNSNRANLPYSTVGTATYQFPATTGTYPGVPILDRIGNSNNAAISGTAFEPANGVKGDIARAYFYIVTRYQNNLSGWATSNGGSTSVGSVVDGATNGGVYPSLQLPYFSMLYNWHINDPVDAREINRNDLIYSQQNNRNPYVDNPAYVERVFSCTGLVPVTILDFSGTLLKGAAQLRWEVTRETAFDKFIIERSFNGTDFSPRAEVKGINAENYSFTDWNLPSNAAVFYRLRLLDASGSFKYSKVIKLLTGSVLGEAQVFPNPAASVITMRVSANALYSVTISDLSGKTIYQGKTDAANGLINLNVESFAKGQYVITASDGKSLQRSKFVKN